MNKKPPPTTAMYQLTRSGGSMGRGTLLLCLYVLLRMEPPGRGSGATHVL